MQSILTHPLRCLAVLCLCLLLQSANAQQLTITFQSQSYNCQTAMLNFSFHISNENGVHSPNQSFLWGVTNGANSTGTTYSGGSEFDGQYLGAYDPNSPLTIWAVGYGNNSAPRQEYTFVPTITNSLSKPNISVSGSPFCTGGNATLTAQQYGGTFEWSNGATGAVLTVSSAGAYRSRVVNSCGAGPWSDYVSVSSISVPNAPSITATNTAVCGGGTAEIYTSFHTGGTINWSNGASGNTITVSNAGTYYATESNACGTSPQSNGVTITSGTVAAAPVIVSSNGTNLCNGDLTTLSVSSSTNGVIHWSGGQTGNSITVSGAGNYRCYETTECGNSDWSNTITITTMGNPAGPIITPNVGRLLCNGESVVLTVNNPIGPVKWSTGETGNSITVNAAGTYYATQTNACATSAPGNLLTFTTANAPGTVSVSASANSICSGQSVTLTTTPTAGGTINWSNGATGSSITVNTAGSYYAWETNACGTGANSNPVTISVGATPSAPVIASASPSVLCDGAAATLSIQGAPQGSVTWSTGETTSSITVSSAGSYTARVTNGCGTSDASNTLTFTTRTTPSAPTVNPAGPLNICSGGSTMLSAVGAGSFMWYRDGNYFSSAGNLIVGNGGTYTVRNTNSCGASPNSNAVVVNVQTRPAAPTVTPPGNQLLCNGQSATFTVSGTDITWSNGANGNTMTTSSAGTYYAFDRNGCGNSDNSNSVVITTGTCPTPSPGTSFYVCPGFLKTLDAGAGYETYQWNTGETTQKISVGPGNYAVTVTKNGCSATSVIVTVSYYTVTTPTILASGPLAFCTGGNVTLVAPSGTAYEWNNGSTASSITVNTAGTYFVTVTDENGCKATSSPKTVVVNPLPTAVISGSTAVCQNAVSSTVTFTGSGGVAPYIFYYKLNDGTTQTITSPSGATATISVPTNTAGTFEYRLVAVQENSATACFNGASGVVSVVVNALPTATITGTITVCKNSAAPMITFTGSGGDAPYTFTYKLNGVTQIVTSSSGSSVDVLAPTNTPGSFVYELVSVQESSGTTCTNTASGNATVTVRDLPTATISGNAEVCQYSTSPSVVFTGSNGTAPYTFTYRINNGANQTVTTANGNTATVSAPTNADGKFTYSLLSVAESGVGTCANVALGTITIVVNPQPATANIAAPNTHLCNGETGTITVLNWQEGFTYTWYKDGVVFMTTTSPSITTTLAGTYTVMVTSDQGCNAASVSNAVIITTGTIPQPVITGKLKVCEGGKTKLQAMGATGSGDYEQYRWTQIHKEPPLYEVLGNDQSFSAFAGQYQLLVGKEGCYDSTVVTVTNNDTEFPAGELKANPSLIPYGGRTRLAAVVNNTEHFEWDFGDGRKAVTVSGSLDQVYYAAQDSIRVMVRAVSERNCMTDFAATVKIGKPVSPVIPDRSFAGNLKDWNFFPVPFRDELKLSVILRKNETVKLDFFTADGSWIRAYELPGRKGENLFSIERVNGLVPGVLYYVTGIYNGEKHYDKIFKY